LPNNGHSVHQFTSLYFLYMFQDQNYFADDTAYLMDENGALSWMERIHANLATIDENVDLIYGNLAATDENVKHIYANLAAIDENVEHIYAKLAAINGND
jgi:hypothetical protein